MPRMRPPSRVSLLAILAACGGTTSRQPPLPERGALEVMAYSPTAPIDKPEPVSIKFDKPVVDDAAIGMAADPRTITVSPAVPWQGHWQDRQTLVIETKGPLTPSTRYHVALAGDLAARTGPFEVAFVYRPLSVRGVEGNADMLPLEGSISLAFTEPVDVAAAAAHCRLEPMTGAPIPLVAPVPAGKAATSVTLHLGGTLVAGDAYFLTCKDLAGAGGDATLDTAFSASVRARPTFSVTGFQPVADAKDPVAADEVDLQLEFSTPVTAEAMHAAISSVPPIPGLADGYLMNDGMTYKVTADLDAQATYKVHLAALTDTFGQKLAAEDHTFKTGDARPRLSLERGIFALEASAKGYPVWSRNVASYDVECGAIPRSKLVQLLTSDMQYDPWGGNDDDKPLDWAKLHVTPTKRAHKIAERNKWVQTPLDLGGTCGGAGAKRGVFLAEIHADAVKRDDDRPWLNPRRNRVLANVTDLGVLIKVGPASGLVWVTSFTTGAPVGGAAVTIYTPSGKAVYTGTTTAEGLLAIPGSVVLKDKPKPIGDAAEAGNDIDNTYDGGRAQRLIAVVESGSDLAVVDGNWSNGIQIWNFAVDEAPSEAQVRIRGFIQSDRGLYRPGEEVHFKGLAREITAIHPPRVPTQQPVTVEVTDSRGQSVMTKVTQLSAFGGFAFDLQLAPDAALGDYYVSAALGTQTFREKFTVEQFRPAAFELAIKGDNQNVKPGDKLAFGLDAKYLFGSPVAGAKVEWNLRRRKHYVTFPGYDEYTFAADPHEYWWSDRRDNYGDYISDGKAETDANGHLAIEASEAAPALDPDAPAADPVPTTAGPVDYIVGASVTDATDQTITKSVMVTAHRTSFYLGVHASEYVQAVDMPFGINLVALRPDGSRAATKAHLRFTRVQWTCTYSQHGYRGYSHCDSKNVVASERDVDLAAAGSHTERVVPSAPGDYLVRIEATDDHGNAVAAESEIYVIGKGEAFWSGDEGDRMTIVASKPVYAPGDVAKLVPMANMINPTALLTVERDGVLVARVTRLASTSEGLTLPIADAWAPNVYASIALVAGRHGPLDKDRPAFKLGTVELKVTATHKELEVAVALVQAIVRPGAPVAGTITVTHAGKPVKAEVSLSAADEGVLQLIAYETPNPMKTFYAPFGLSVEPATNWNRIARLADPTAGDPDQGGDSASKVGAQRVRSKFVASAYWAPALVTNDAGVIHFAFTAPDNLSAFRLMAIAADIGEQFGAGETRLTVNKPLMAQPTLPRFLRTGDDTEVGVLLHNTTDVGGVASVIATADGASLATSHQEVALPAHGEARVRFAARALDAAVAATFKFDVAMGRERDAVAVTLPIEKPRLRESRSLVETLLPAGQTWTSKLETRPGVLRDESMLTLTIDRTGAGDLAPSLKALVEYPYGCLEQTLSHMVPLIAAEDLAATLDDGSLDHTKAQHYIDVGVAKVLRHQHADGQFSLWPDSQTYPHLTAYALWGLTVAQQGGVAVPAEVFDHGLAGLSEYANKHLGEDNNSASMAMAAYVMALRGKPDASLDARLYAARGTLPKWGQAFLLRALALAKADRGQIRELETLLLLNLVQTDGGLATVHETATREELDMYWGSDARSTAVTLLALLEVDLQSKMIEPLAAGLKSQRGKNSAWASTQENVWALIALAQYAKRGAAGETTATISIGGAALPERHLSGAQIATIQIPLTKIADAAAVVVSVDHGAHVSARVTEVRVDVGAGDHHGFTVVRRYLDAKGAPVSTVKAGDLVTIRIEIETDDPQRWVAVNDPIPAGFEAVNTKLAESGAAADPAAGVGDGTGNSHDWHSYAAWDYQEMRDDAVRWFADAMTKGSHVIEYQARATISGTFTAMPATVENMYHPDVHGRSDKRVLTVTP